MMVVTSQSLLIFVLLAVFSCFASAVVSPVAEVRTAAENLEAALLEVSAFHEAMDYLKNSIMTGIEEVYMDPDCYTACRNFKPTQVVDETLPGKLKKIQKAFILLSNKILATKNDPEAQSMKKILLSAGEVVAKLEALPADHVPAVNVELVDGHNLTWFKTKLQTYKTMVIPALVLEKDQPVFAKNLIGKNFGEALEKIRAADPKDRQTMLESLWKNLKLKAVSRHFEKDPNAEALVKGMLSFLAELDRIKAWNEDSLTSLINLSKQIVQPVPKETTTDPEKEEDPETEEHPEKEDGTPDSFYMYLGIGVLILAVILVVILVGYRLGAAKKNVEEQEEETLAEPDQQASDSDSDSGEEVRAKEEV